MDNGQWLMLGLVMIVAIIVATYAGEITAIKTAQYLMIQGM